jgi:hypothetical protein
MALVSRAAGQAAVEPAPEPIVRRLAGGWRGEGELMGRAARFEMCWEEAVGGAFMRLRFTNYFVTATGDQRVLESVGYYPASAGQRAGTWVDSRGVLLSLDVQQGPMSLTVVWTGGESGRTTYSLTSDTTMTAVDEVRTSGEYRSFARARLRRGEVPSCGTP